MRRMVTIGAGVAMLVLLGAGVIHLFLLRFQAGDVYPPYSSLRADPLGTRAFYESLAGCPGMTVDRNFLTLNRFRATPDATLLFLGDTVSRTPNNDSVPNPVVHRLNRFVKDGGRLAITLLPIAGEASSFRNTMDDLDRDDDEAGDRGGTNAVDAAENDPSEPRADVEPAPTNRTLRIDEPESWVDPAREAKSKTNRVDRSRGRRAREREESVRAFRRNNTPLTNWLGLAFGRVSSNAAPRAVLDSSVAETGLPATLACRTGLCFTNLAAEWQVLYRLRGQPVVVERPLGRGTMVLSAATFFVSNEALRKEREPALLAWLVGGHTAVIFDETHLGVYESPNVATLLRRYGMVGVGWVMLALAVLFIWQNSTSLVPAGRERGRGQAVARGRDSLSGLTNVLRRSLGAGPLLRACWTEWCRQGPAATVPGPRAARVEALVAAAEQGRAEDTVTAYNAICREVEKEDYTTRNNTNREKQHEYGKTEDRAG